MNISGAHVGLVMDPGDVVVEVVAGGQRDAAIATEVQPRAREVDVLNVLLKGVGRRINCFRMCYLIAIKATKVP